MRSTDWQPQSPSGTRRCSIMLDLSIVIAGAAGEGVQTIGDVVSRTLLALGYPVFTTQEYESRIRGGTTSYRVRVSETVRNAPRHDADLLLALNSCAQEHYAPLLNENGRLLTEERDGTRGIAVPFSEIATERFGRKIYANAVAAGALLAAIGGDFDALGQVLRATFASKGEDIAQANVEAARAGHDAAGQNSHFGPLATLPRREQSFTLISANEAIPLAAAYAGCRFIAAYPMSPSTGIITALSRDKDLGVFAEQAEDEIAALNMAIGASFAGARAMTATSGGGFALMVEAVSLSGMTETPIVIALAQRPGPATGLPTRTAQEDILFAIHAGHGEFPKLVLAPSDPQDAFEKIVRAFNLADLYQIPVIVLTDQFLADARFSFEHFEINAIGPETHLADPQAITEYNRYRLTENGISPRLYPGQSDHLVCLDSDEHTEAGHITEDLAHTRPVMVQKRLAKLHRLKQEIAPPEEAFLDDAETILIGWGSTRGAIAEAVEGLRKEGRHVGMLHFTEVWPLPDYTFPEGKRYIAVEGNATGQFARLLRAEYGLNVQGRINRYDGLPISAKDIRREFDGRS